MRTMDLSADGLAAQDWQWGNIAGAKSPAELVRLAKSTNTTAMMALVRFPAGWERPESGTADRAEEFLVLAGQVELSGVMIEAGETALITPGAVRSGMRTTDGCTIVAWFSAPPTWDPRDTPSLDGKGIVTTSGEQAYRETRDDIPGSVRVEQSLAGGIADTECDVLALGSRQWWFVSAGEELPTCAEPVIVRHWS